MIKLALIGKNIAHSQSASVYNRLLPQAHTYTLLDFARPDEIPSLSELFQSYDGINITTPYKSFFFANVTSPTFCQNIHAINCIKLDSDRFSGTNTDYLACFDTLKEFLYQHQSVYLIILGNGVMAKTVAVASANLQIPFTIYARQTHGDLSNLNLQKIITPNNHQVIVVNTCSRSFIFKGLLSPDCFFWDMNYNFIEHQSTLPKACQKYINGTELLERQAAYAVSFWNFSN